MQTLSGVVTRFLKVYVAVLPDTTVVTGSLDRQTKWTNTKMFFCFILPGAVRLATGARRALNSIICTPRGINTTSFRGRQAQTDTGSGAGDFPLFYLGRTRTQIRRLLSMRTTEQFEALIARVCPLERLYAYKELRALRPLLFMETGDFSSHDFYAGEVDIRPRCACNCYSKQRITPEVQPTDLHGAPRVHLLLTARCYTTSLREDRRSCSCRTQMWCSQDST